MVWTTGTRSVKSLGSFESTNGLKMRILVRSISGRLQLVWLGMSGLIAKRDFDLAWKNWTLWNRCRWRSRTKVANHAENEEADAEVQTDISLVNTPTFPAAPRPMIPQRREPPEQVPVEDFSLPGSPRSEKSGDVPDLPLVGLDLHDINVLLAHFPPGQRKRVERIREVSLFSEQSLREFMLCHLMKLFPGQPDLHFGFPLWWNRQDQHEYKLFNDIVVGKKYQEQWGSFCEQWFIHQDFPRRRNH